MTGPSPALTRPTSTPSRLRSLLPADQTLRVLAEVTLINTLGNGLFYTTGALFFTRSLGLTPGQVGVGLAGAGMCGIVAGPPLGALADRWGVKRTLLALFAADGIGSFGYLVIRGFPAFLVLASVIAFVDRGASAVRNALVGGALPPERRVYGRAYLRAVANVGMGTGSALAAAALQSNTRTAYLAVVAADAITFLLAGAALLRLRPVARPAPAGGASQTAVARPPSRTMRAR